MPLYVQNGNLLKKAGALGTSVGCCCDPPLPPPGCWCPDYCLYQIEILSPVQYGPSPPVACGGGGGGSVDEKEQGGGAYAEEFEISLYPPCEDETQCCGPVTAPVAVNRVYASADSGYAIVRYSSELSAIAGAEISLRCENLSEPGVVYADISLSIIVPGSIGLVDQTPRRLLNKFATVALDTTCSLRTGVTCNPVDPNDQVRFAFLDVPLEFTVNAASAGLTGWDASKTVDVPIGDQTRVTPCFNHLVNNFEATFRITARENCLPPEPYCCCKPIEGSIASRISENTPPEECDGDSITKPDEPTDIDTMTVVVEWDGLTFELNSANGFNSGIVSEGIATFECVQPGPFIISADQRGMGLASPVNASSDVCNLWQFSGLLQLFFEGVGPFGGRPQSGINLDIFVSECHDGYVSPIPPPGTHPSWCPNAYAEPVVTLVVAP
jgi:hypothetical protein